MPFFESPHYVRIHGKTVSTIYRLLMVLLVACNALYLVWKGHHMSVDVVKQGHIFAFLEPGKASVVSKRNVPYCGTEKEKSKGKNIKKSLQSFIRHCEIVDAQELVQSHRGRLFVRTSRRITKQRRDCPASAFECPRPLWKDFWQNQKKQQAPSVAKIRR